jgi:CRISPR-associated Csx2 family protein
MSKVFISFLGVNNYLTCNYEMAGKGRVESVKYVQEATLKLFCSDFTEGDKILIFLTSEARKRNWPDNGHKIKSDNYDTCEGLESRINKIKLPASLIDIDIPEGFTEEQIWEIFDVVYRSINPGDQLTIDITHAFRSIPMLGLVLLNYLKVLKVTDVAGIYYGAFEALGPYQEVKSMKLDQRNAKILDLTPLWDLQQWSVAAHSFIKYGMSGDIINLADSYKKMHKPLMSKELSRDFSSFSNSLHDLCTYFSTVRGKFIIEGKIIRKIRENISGIKSKHNLQPLSSLFDKIEEKIQNFNENDVLNGFHAVEWCINHSLIQQGITLLQEMVVTYLCEVLNEKYKLRFQIKSDREFITNCLNLYNKMRWEWKDIDVSTYEAVIQIQNEEIFQKLAEPYLKLPQYRNNINHGGFVEDFKPELFNTKLVESYNEIRSIIFND